jgi:hypothetical protein
MTMTFNPNATANKNPTFNPMAQFEALKFDTAVPEAGDCGDANARGL